MSRRFYVRFLPALVVFIAPFVSPAHAQEAPIVTADQTDAYVQEFAQDADRPPVVDGMGGYTDEEIEEIWAAIQAAEAQGEPEEDVVPGQMWSDEVALPPAIDKAEADQAEVMIAEEQEQLDLGRQMLRADINRVDAFAAAPNCRTFWPSTHRVCGAILEQFLVHRNWLLMPTGPETLNPDGQGYRQQFSTGVVYWHPRTGAHAVASRTAAVWARHGWEAGWLGYPTTGEYPVRGNSPIEGEINGWVQEFEGGRIYRSSLGSGQQVASINGFILQKWLELGGPNSELGFPIADEARTADGVGRFSVFQRGTIYWHPRTGAHEVSGINYFLWKLKGAEQSEYGYPTGSPTLTNLGHYTQPFEHKELRFAEEIATYGEHVEDGKVISSIFGAIVGVASPAAAEGTIDSGAYGVQRLAAETSYPHPPNPNDGGIPIPLEYEFYGPNSGDGLHDFCTKSPDQLYAAGKSAGFYGPCSKHDMCYQVAQDIVTGGVRGRNFKGEPVFVDEARAFRACDSNFDRDLYTVCWNEYGPGHPYYGYCESTRTKYYGAVVAFHSNHYFASDWWYD